MPRWRLVRPSGRAGRDGNDLSLIGRGDSELEGKTKVLLADAPTQGHLDRLPVGTLGKVIYATDPWLRRYRGMRAVVGRDDGLSVDVLLSCGHLMSFWRSEVKPLTATTDIWAEQGSGSKEPHDILLEDGAVSGHSLQGERRRSGVTQAAIAR